MVKNHQKSTESSEAIFCHICNCKISEIDKLRRHIREVHEMEYKRKFSCKKCRKTFKRKEHLIRHQMAEHWCLKFVCSMCSKKFYEKCRLDRHLEQSHNLYTCPKCGDQFDLGSFLGHKQACKSERPRQKQPRFLLSCRYCTKTYKRA